MLSAVYILDLRGKVLISRQYRCDIPASIPEKFISLLQQGGIGGSSGPYSPFTSSSLFNAPEMPSVASNDISASCPILTYAGYHFLYVRHADIYLLAITTSASSNAMTVFLFLHRLIDIFKDYFKEIEEESIRDNFVIIYELLDEMMDFGYPQFTDPSVLHEYIVQEGHKLNRLGSKLTKKPPLTSHLSIAWRPEGLSYKKNEVFLDVIEKINLFMNAEGSVLDSEILGAIRMRCDLSGMPELRLGLNDTLQALNSTDNNISDGTSQSMMQDVKFHQCVRLEDFTADRTISFIPPDGSFELMSYRLPASIVTSLIGQTGGLTSQLNTSSISGFGASSAMSPLLLFLPDVTMNVYSGTRVEILFSMKCTAANSATKKKSIASSSIICNEVCISIPVEEDAMNVRFKNKRRIGNVQYCPESNAVVWKLKHLPLFSTRDLPLKVEYNLPTIRRNGLPSMIKTGSKISGNVWQPISSASSPAAASGLASSSGGVIHLTFEIPYFSVSGLQVKYLKIIEKSGYQALPWVRYITQNGNYQMRLPPPNLL